MIKATETDPFVVVKQCGLEWQPLVSLWQSAMTMETPPRRLLECVFSVALPASLTEFLWGCLDHIEFESFRSGGSFDPKLLKKKLARTLMLELGEIMPRHLNEDEERLLEAKLAEVFSTLTPREGRVLELRFGLDNNQPQTLRAIGRLLNLTPERIRQIEARALRKLRHPTRSKHLNSFWFWENYARSLQHSCELFQWYAGKHGVTLKEISEAYKEERRRLTAEEIEAQRRHDEEEVQARMIENLNRPVDELGFSVRSANCLKNSNIRYIYELVEKTEAEMLNTRNFGRKSLREVNEVLAGMGLGLGMKFDEVILQNVKKGG